MSKQTYTEFRQKNCPKCSSIPSILLGSLHCPDCEENYKKAGK